MKYSIQIQNKYGNTFTVSSMDNYSPKVNDIESFTQVLGDPAVRKYITDQAMEKYNIASIEEMSKEILNTSSKRWEDREEFRFIVRNNSDKIVGMIGVDINDNENGELWYFKIASAQSFMHEALQPVLNFLKKENVKSLIATYKPENIRSIEILKKLNFKENDNENEMRFTY
jgi:RimJ/RimL family protein N-acetyltransferase